MYCEAFFSLLSDASMKQEVFRDEKHKQQEALRSSLLYFVLFPLISFMVISSWIRMNETNRAIVHKQYITQEYLLHSSMPVPCDAFLLLLPLFKALYSNHFGMRKYLKSIFLSPILRLELRMRTEIYSKCFVCLT